MFHSKISNEVSMRKPFVAGNWKMNKTAEQARLLVSELLPGLQSVSGVEQVVCPPFTSIMAVSAMLSGTQIGLGAQNMYWKESGAFTGEVSPQMVKEFCQYVILGHSERRTYFGETDATVNLKLKAAFATGLVPIMCIGETLEENEDKLTVSVLSRQLRLGLEGIDAQTAAPLVIAYEPVWAIGTGRAASGPMANQIITEAIRNTLQTLYNKEMAESIRVLYGGSVTAANAAEFFGQSEIDGALVGGASLKADYINLVKAAAR
jgi:triosephosphate isomerase